MDPRGSPAPPQLHGARLPRRLPSRCGSLLARAALHKPGLTPRPDLRERRRCDPREWPDDPRHFQGRLELREQWPGPSHDWRHPDRSAMGRIGRVVLLRRRPARPGRRHSTSVRRPQLALHRPHFGRDHHRGRDRPRSARGLLRRGHRLDHFAVLRPDLGLPGHPARDRARYRPQHQRLPPRAYQHCRRQPLDPDCRHRVRVRPVHRETAARTGARAP